ncbi:MAG: cadherin-like domain-containing protein [Candidatus Eisenbacteria bacterium]|nr:cadherin-like domain-containing protein [Candidatus Eisenbacteria bacterium]
MQSRIFRRSICLTLFPLLFIAFVPRSDGALPAVQERPGAERIEGDGARPSPLPRENEPDVHWFGFYDPITGAAVEDSVWTFDHGAADPLEGWAAEDRTACDFTAFRWIDPSEWYGHDNTIPEPVLSGYGSIWCGFYEDQADSAGWVNGLGYGNLWKQWVDGPELTYDGSGSVDVDFIYFADTEEDYDFVYVIVDFPSLGVMDTIATFDGVDGSPSIPSSFSRTVDFQTLTGGLSAAFHIRFLFVSDSGYSDEDGIYDCTSGPFCVDDILLTNNIVGGNRSYDFETGPQGFTPGSFEGVGAWLLADNEHHYSLPPYSVCGLRDSILAMHDGSRQHPDGQFTEAFSPPVPVSSLGAGPWVIFADYDIYADLPSGSCEYWQVGWSYYPYDAGNGPEWSPRVGKDANYYTGSPTCWRDRLFGRFEAIGDTTIPADADSVRLVFGFLNLCPDGSGCDCASNPSRPNPFFDNIRIGVNGAHAIHVPGDYATIQTAIDSAGPGDTVVVAAGTYSPSTNGEAFPIEMKGHVALIAPSGPASTIIDAEGTGRVLVALEAGHTQTTFLRGFTVTGGVATGADSTGGGFYVDRSSVRIDSCVFHGNTASFAGGALYGSYVTPPITSSTFGGNEAPAGAAIYIEAEGLFAIELNNVIVAWNDGGAGIAMSDTAAYGILACCDVYGNEGGDYVGCIEGLEGTDGNIRANPVFCNLAAGDLHLHAGSPCLAAPGCGRIGALGAGDCWRTWYVPSEAPTIQAAFDTSAAGDTVEIAAGTYHEHDLDIPSRRTVRGATGDPADVIVDAQDLGRVFLTEDEGILVEDLTLTGGNASGSGLDGLGGGYFCDFGDSVTFRNCVFTDNESVDQGGGARTIGYHLFENCIFTNNTSENGGGIYTSQDSVILRNCVFQGNTVTNHGGAIFATDGAVRVESCLVSGNQGVGGGTAGGGASFASLSRATVVETEISGNTANYCGGVSFADQGSMTGCVIVGNEGLNYGGGVQLGGATVGFSNCTIAFNDAPFGAGILSASGYPSLDRCIIAFNKTGEAFSCDFTAPVSITCTDIYGNDGGDWIDSLAALDSVDGNFHADPMFCGSESPEDSLALRDDSPCAIDTCALQSPRGVIGARPAGCGGSVVNWSGGGDGVSWSDPANWDPARVPTSSDAVRIVSAESTVVVVAMDTTVYSLTVGGGRAENKLVIESDTLTLLAGGGNFGEIEIRSEAAIEIGLDPSAVFTNEATGLIRLVGGSIIGEGTFINGGEVRNEDDGGKSRAIGTIAISFLNVFDDPGDGAIVVAGGTLAIEDELANAGSLMVRTTATMMLDPGDGAVQAEGITNSGVCVVEDGATFDIRPEQTIFLNEVGGVFVLEGGDITGPGLFRNRGTLMKDETPRGGRSTGSIACGFETLFEDPGDGAIVVNDGTLEIEGEFANAGSCFVRNTTEMLLDPGDGPNQNGGQNNEGVIEVEEGATLRVQGEGTIFVNRVGGEVILSGGDLDGTGTFRNRGTVRKIDPPAKSRATSRIGCSFANLFEDPGDGAILAEAGALDIEGTFDNGGEVRVDSGAAIDLDSASTAANDGSITIKEDGELVVDGDVTNEPSGEWIVRGETRINPSGTFTNEGTTELDGPGSSIVNEGTFLHEENAVLSGTGTFDNTVGTFTGDGIFAPGGSPGILTFLGDFVSGATSEIRVELGGTAAGTEYDRLAISGDATLGGGMHVTYWNGFEPLEGDSFAVVVFGGRATRDGFDCYSGLGSESSYLRPKIESDAFALVAVDSTAANQDPSAAADAESTDAVTPIVIDVLANDSDPDMDPLRIVAVSLDATVGDASVDPGDTTITYTPSPSFAGTDSIRYLVTDCLGGIDSALVEVVVGRAPRVWTVPVAAPTIEAGLDSAWEKDTVEIAAGTYYEHDIELKAGVVLRGGTGDPADVIVDADSLGRVFRASQLSDPPRLEAITITGGYSPDLLGVGLRVYQTDMTIHNCRFVGNSSGYRAGGLYIAYCSPTVTECLFEDNHAVSGSTGIGGGIYCVRDTTTFDQCVVAENSADLVSGIFGNHSLATFSRCTIVGNVSYDSADGSGIGLENSTQVYENSIVAFHEGGSAFRVIGTGDPYLFCCDIYGNSGGDWTGRIADQLGVDGNFSADPFFCTVDGNANDPYGIDAKSPCAEAEQPSCGRIGARPAACTVVAVGEGGNAPPPMAFRLHANRPNPFNPTTAIRFDIPRAGAVRLAIYDVRGRRVAVLAEGRYEAGSFEARWTGLDSSGRAVASGIYFALFEADGHRETRKMVLLR